MNLREYLKENRLITDGAMGTYFDSKKQSELTAEVGNVEAPELVKKIHKEYIRAGARLLRTNTFELAEEFFGTREKKAECIIRACAIARKAVEECREEGILLDSEPVFIGADIGPVNFDYQSAKEEILKDYLWITDCFLKENVDCFVFETQAEFGLLSEVTSYIKSKGDIFILVQFSFDKTGYTKAGLSIPSMVRTMEREKTVDAYGFNCGMSSAHLYRILSTTAFEGNKYISALPNASYTSMNRGKIVYSNNVPYFADMMEKLDDIGIRIMGGCCGTTPNYIRSLADRLKDRPLRRLQTFLSDSRERSVEQKENPLMAKLNRGEKVIMVELDPPFGENADKVLEGASFLKGKGTDVITLSDSPLGRARMDSALLAVKVFHETGMPVMPHISCRDKNIIALRGLLLGLAMNDIHNLLIVTGDPVQKGDGVKQVFEYNSIRFMKYIKTMNEDIFAEHPFFYGGALNYNGVNKEAIAVRMKSKMESGVSCFLTQPVYSDEDIERITYLQNVTGAKIIAGIMPLVSHKNAVFIQNEMPGIHISDEIMDRYVPNLSREEYEDIAVEVSVDIIKKLEDIAAGYYFMTPFNRYVLIQRIINRIFTQ